MKYGMKMHQLKSTKSRPRYAVKIYSKDIVEYYNKNHLIITQIKQNFKDSKDFPKATAKDISLIIQSLDPKRVTSSDSISIKVIKSASKIIDSHLCNIINTDLQKRRYFPEEKKQHQ